jgi:DNA-binding SARP family transcriptional activator
MSRLSLWLLGPFQAELDGRSLRGFRSAKIRALLAYLAVETQRPWARATLAGLLWPDFPEETAQSNLRNALSNLRHVLGDQQAASPFLDITPATVQFNAASCWLDVHAFQQSVPTVANLTADFLGDQAALARLEEALALYRGEFLDGFALESAPFEAWLLAMREQLQQKAAQTARLLALAQAQGGDLAAATAATQRWLALEPWEEAAHRHLMQLLARRGQRGAALAQYATCRQQLAEELGIEPEAETVRLVEEIRDGRFPPTPHAPTPTWPGLGLPAHSLEPTLFVSRQTELEKLANALIRAAAGQGGVHFITGEPGSGKTALLAEFARRALDHHSALRVAWGQCNAFTGQGDPYFPFIHIVRALVGEKEAQIAPGESSSELARRLWRALPATVDALLDHAPDLVNRFFSGSSLLAFAQQHSGVPPGRLSQLAQLLQQAVAQPPQKQLPQTALFEQFTQVLCALAQRRPLLLILDDMQWIDPGSVSLLFHLARRLAGSRILLLGATARKRSPCRGSGQHPCLDMVSELQPAYGELQLDLMRSDGMAFVAALLDSEPHQLARNFAPCSTGTPPAIRCSPLSCCAGCSCAARYGATSQGNG